MQEFGNALNSVVIERGLQELQPGLHFDWATKEGKWHPYQSTRQGVFYQGKHICSMDRGIVPEFKIWSVKEQIVPASIAEADNEDVHVHYKVIPPQHPGYLDLWDAASKGRLEEYRVRTDGNLIQLSAFRIQKARHRIVRVGWRHTFERLLKEDIPGITRQSLAAKFSVDMYKIPVGPLNEIVAALRDE